MTQAPKLFVLDTNVILHDSGCIRNFEENDIVIPITVLEDLDKFKKGHEDIHYQAASFSATWTRSPATCCPTKGPPWGPAWVRSASCSAASSTSGCGRRFFTTPRTIGSSTCLCLRKREPTRRVILVSKDTNLRMKAKSLGLPAQDYTNDKVESVEKLYPESAWSRACPASRSTPFMPRAAKCPADRPAGDRRAGGQRALHSAQRLEVGADDLPPQRPDVRAGRQSRRPTGSSPATRSNRSPWPS